MRPLKALTTSKGGKLAMAALALFVLSAPALANHFDFDDLVGEDAAPTAEDLHVDCPAEGEEATADETAKCDDAVKQAFEQLEDYDHPENHGKYVSYVAHCLKGMKGKGQVMRQIAHEKGDDQAELAVRLCAEWQVQQAQEESSEEASTKAKKDKKDKKVKSAEAEEESAEAEEESAEAEEESDANRAQKDKKVKNKKGKGGKR